MSFTGGLTGQYSTGQGTKNASTPPVFIMSPQSALYTASSYTLHGHKTGEDNGGDGEGAMGSAGRQKPAKMPASPGSHRVLLGITQSASVRGLAALA